MVGAINYFKSSRSAIKSLAGNYHISSPYPSQNLNLTQELAHGLVLTDTMSSSTNAKPRTWFSLAFYPESLAP